MHRFVTKPTSYCLNTEAVRPISVLLTPGVTPAAVRSSLPHVRQPWRVGGTLQLHHPGCSGWEPLRTRASVRVTAPLGDEDATGREISLIETDGSRFKPLFVTKHLSVV